MVEADQAGADHPYDQGRGCRTALKKNSRNNAGNYAVDRFFDGIFEIFANLDVIEESLYLDAQLKHPEEKKNQSGRKEYKSFNHAEIPDV